jgi:hypothetical protein
LLFYSSIVQFVVVLGSIIKSKNWDRHLFIKTIWIAIRKPLTLFKQIYF